MALLIRFWREIIIVLMAVVLYSIWSIYSNRIKDRDNTIAKMTAEAKLGEIQQDALRKAIIDQSDAVEKQRIDAEKRAAKFEEESKQIWSDFERTKSEIQNLSGDVECEAMRKIVREAVR